MITNVQASYLIIIFTILSSIALSIKAIMKREIVLIPGIVARIYYAFVSIIFVTSGEYQAAQDIHIALASLFGIDLITTIFYNFSRKYKIEIENKNLRVMLHKQIQKYSLIVETSQIAMYAFSHSGRFIFVNQKMCDMLGYTREEFYSKTFYDITLSKYHDTVRKNIEDRFKETVQTVVYDVEMITKRGNIIKVKLSGSIVHNGEKHIVGTALQLEE